MTVYYYCNKGTNANAACVNGNNANSGLTPALARQTIAQFVTDWQAGVAGDQFLFAQGASWDAVSTGQIKNGNFTKANPGIIGSYDASSVWVGGAGTRPRWDQASLSTDMLNFAKGTLTHTEGYVIQGIDFRGGLRCIIGNGDIDYITIQDCNFQDGTIAIQLASGSTSATSATSDGVSSNLIIKNNTFSTMSGQGILTAMDHMLVENNTFDHIGTTQFDHGLYIGGGANKLFPQTISSITGDGTTATITTSAPHNIPAGLRFTVTIVGSTSSGTGTFNGTSLEGTRTGASTFTVGTIYSPVTGTPTASAVGTYTCSVEQNLTDIVVRGNSFTNGNVGVAGSSNNAHIVMHGVLRRILIENNSILENTLSSSTTSVGIEIDSGLYSPPDNYEKFPNFVIRGNTVKNLRSGMLVDITQKCLIENNYIYSESTQDAVGIRMRSRCFQSSANFSGTATAGTSSTLTDSGKTFSWSAGADGAAGTAILKLITGTGAGQIRHILSKTATVITVQPNWSVTPDATTTYAMNTGSGVFPEHTEPDQVTIRYNTVYLTAPTGFSVGINLNACIVDPLLGGSHNMYGNLVVFGSTATTATMAYNTDNLTISQFTVKDYNACYYLSASVPKWEGTSSLATIQAVADANRSELHSTMASTASVSAGQPFFTAPLTSPAVGASSSNIANGHPTLVPKLGWGGIKRTLTPVRGAYAYGDSAVVPYSQIFSVVA